MNDYEMIFKRKSFHMFGNVEKLSAAELEALNAFTASVRPLDPTIRTAFRIVPERETSCHCGAEYCILFYSEKAPNDLRNIGYIGEQVDLYCASQNIGACWYGLGNTKEVQLDGLDFVIMIAIGKKKEGDFRKDLFKAKRKPLEEIWHGETLGVAEIARFAPSACNSQPWIVEKQGNTLSVYRFKKPGRSGLMPANAARYFNRIDIGIFLWILETCLTHEGISFTGRQFEENADDSVEKVLISEYTLG